MTIKGEYTIQAPRESVWRSLLDPQVIARVIPGCDALEETGRNEYKGVIRIGVGSIHGRFEGLFALSNLQPPESYHLKLSGKGAPGFLEGAGDIQLVENGDSTLMRYEVDAQIGGRIASVGQRLLESTARMVAKHGLERLNGVIVANLQERSDQSPSQPS